MAGRTIHDQKISDSAIDLSSYNAICAAARKVGNIKFDQRYFRVQENAYQILITLRDLVSDVSDKTFRTSVSGRVCTVYAGTLRLHGIGKYPVVETDLTMTTNPCWVYLGHMRDHSVTELKMSSTEPESTTTELMIPLAKFTPNSDLTVYTRDFTCTDGDINLDTPIM